MSAKHLWQTFCILTCGVLGAWFAVYLTLDRDAIATSLFGVLGLIGGMGLGGALLVNPGEGLVGLVRMLGKMGS